MAKVKVIKPFRDLESKTTRVLNEEYDCSEKRAKELVSEGHAILIEDPKEEIEKKRK